MRRAGGSQDTRQGKPGGAQKAKGKKAGAAAAVSQGTREGDVTATDEGTISKDENAARGDLASVQPPPGPPYDVLFLGNDELAVAVLEGLRARKGECGREKPPLPVVRLC